MLNRDVYLNFIIKNGMINKNKYCANNSLPEHYFSVILFLLLNTKKNFLNLKNNLHKKPIKMS